MLIEYFIFVRNIAESINPLEIQAQKDLEDPDLSFLYKITQRMESREDLVLSSKIQLGIVFRVNPFDSVIFINTFILNIKVQNKKRIYKPLKAGTLLDLLHINGMKSHANVDFTIHNCYS